MQYIDQTEQVLACLQAGGIIAYPTEAVYGLGCDPWNESAVSRLLALKQRPVEKGLILLIGNWSQLDALILPIPEDRMQIIRQSWPGPVTWVFPSAPSVPTWVTGIHSSIAVRMTAHPIAHALCLPAPLISTSANVSAHPPARSVAALLEQFPVGIDACVTGALGSEQQPSRMLDALTGMCYR